MKASTTSYPFACAVLASLIACGAETPASSPSSSSQSAGQARPGQMQPAAAGSTVAGLLAYPAGLYPKALESLLKLVPPNVMSSYIWEGTLHQNLFQTASADRFYEKNGLNQSVAEWLTDLLAGNGTRIGSIQ